MKKNSIKTILGAGLFCLAMSSCGDFLNIEPKTFVSEDNFWNEKKDIDQLIAGTYTKMQDENFIRRCIVWGEVRGGDVAEGKECETKHVDVYRTLREYLLSTNQFTDWTQFYNVINQCNIIIARAPEVSEKDPTYTASDVLATQAEATFLRSLAYFYLVRAFEDVPYYTNPVQSDDDAEPRAATKGDDIIRSLIADLESVVGNALKAYPDDNVVNASIYYDSNCNRVTQNAIYALLADLCLWDGQYKKCIDYCQRVINAKRQKYQEKWGRMTATSSSGIPYLFKWDDDTDTDPLTGVMGYPLYPCFQASGSDVMYGNDFRYNFGVGSSFESIFELAFTPENANDGNHIHNRACSLLYGNYLPGNNGDHNDGEGYLAVHENVSTDITNATPKVFSSSRDCRFYTSQQIIGGTSSASSSTYIAKFVQSSRVITPGSGSSYDISYGFYSYANRNWIFYRLTDVMLMEAEALIESARYDDYKVMTTDNLGASVPLLDDNGDQVYEENLKRAFALIYAVNRRSIMVNATANTTLSNAYHLKFDNYGTRAALRNLCMKERRCELMFEGKRWFDMIRYWHRDGRDEFVKSIPARSGGTVPVSYEALFWPYNKYELQNNPLLKQKAYYGDDSDEGNFSSTK